MVLARRALFPFLLPRQHERKDQNGHNGHGYAHADHGHEHAHEHGHEHGHGHGHDGEDCQLCARHERFGISSLSPTCGYGEVTAMSGTKGQTELCRFVSEASFIAARRADLAAGVLNVQVEVVRSRGSVRSSSWDLGSL